MAEVLSLLLFAANSPRITDVEKDASWVWAAVVDGDLAKASEFGIDPLTRSL